MLASWSSAVQSISSPGARSRPIARDGERERGHVGAEDNTVGIGHTDEVGHGPTRLADGGIAAAAGQKGPTRVGVGGEEVRRHGVDDAPGYLRARGVIEKDAGAAVVESHREGRKLGAHTLDVKHQPSPQYSHTTERGRTSVDVRPLSVYALGGS